MRETREVEDSSGGAYLFFFAIYRARALRVALLLQQQRQLEEADKDEPVVTCVSCPRDGERCNRANLRCFHPRTHAPAQLLLRATES